MAFDKINAVLSFELVLKTLDFLVPFNLEVDSCETGVGAVLLQ